MATTVNSATKIFSNNTTPTTATLTANQIGFGSNSSSNMNLYISDGININAYPLGLPNAGSAATANVVQTLGTSTVDVMSQDVVSSTLNAKAPLNSPALTGLPTAPTAAVGTSTTQVATTAFVQAAVPNAQVRVDWNATGTAANSIINKPTLATVATTGIYNDLLNKPTLAIVATSGSYTDLINKPVNVTTSTAGLMSAADKAKLDSLESPKYLGFYTSQSQLLLSYPNNGTGGQWGNYVGDKLGCSADVMISGVAHQFVYDGSSTWVDMGVTGGDTAEMVKQKYESNSDTNAFTDALKLKLENIEPNATKQVQTDWNATTGMGVLLNKPTLAAVATSGSYTDLSNKPTIPAAQVQSDWNASSGMGVILNKPSILQATGTSTTDIMSQKGITDALNTKVNTSSLATVATTGSYNDLLNKPSIPSVGNGTITITQGGTTKGTFTTNQNGNTTVALDASASFSGNYNDLTNKPSIPSYTSQLYNDSGFITSSSIPSVGNGAITLRQGGTTRDCPKFCVNRKTTNHRLFRG